MPDRPTAVMTGSEGVDAALAHLDGLDDVPVADHVTVFDAVHRGLQDALATLDEV